jgi:hypothetical protein
MPNFPIIEAHNLVVSLQVVVFCHGEEPLHTVYELVLKVRV